MGTIMLKYNIKCWRINRNKFEIHLKYFELLRNIYFSSKSSILQPISLDLKRITITTPYSIIAN